MMNASDASEAPPSNTAKRRKQYLSSTEWYLYPPPNTTTTTTLVTNDFVYIKSKSSKPGTRGRVVQDAKLDTNRVQVQVLSSLTNEERIVNVARKRCIFIYRTTTTTTTTTTTVLLTNETYAYRHLAASQISTTDAVLEIGCSTGQASHLMLQTTNKWMGMDVSNTMLEQARAYLQTKGHFLSLDQLIRHDILVDPRTAETIVVRQQFHPPRVVFIDIGGNRDMSSAIRVLQWCIATWSPRLIVVKNQELVHDMLQDCTTSTSSGKIAGAADWFQQQQQQQVAVDRNETTWWPAHALQAPMVLSPRDGVTPICRYHNYHPEGCKKGTHCPFHHSHCHKCCQPGHAARTCPLRRHAAGYTK
jgi:predicted O-methyltransferase YrrM